MGLIRAAPDAMHRAIVRSVFVKRKIAVIWFCKKHLISFTGVMTRRKELFVIRTDQRIHVGKTVLCAETDVPLTAPAEPAIPAAFSL